MAEEDNGESLPRADIPLPELIGAKTIERMRLIDKDARSVALIFILPCCIPVFGPLSTAWMVVRLMQWYRINAQYGETLRHVIAEPWDAISAGDIELTQRFLDSKRDVWIGTLFWPILVSGVLIAISLRDVLLRK